MCNKETIIFVKGEKDLSIPEKCEGIFYPLKFDSEEFLKWKNELDPDIRTELLRSEHKDESSLYFDVYNAIDKNFATASDREFMAYIRFLVDPRDPEGKPSDEDPTKINYRKLHDSECRFGGEYKELYSEFITILRHCAFRKPCLAPRYVMEAINADKIIEMGGDEYSLTIDHIPNDCWTKIFRWPVLKNFIANKKAKFPDLDHILDMYGEPISSGIDSNVVNFNGDYVDIVSDDSSFIIASLIESFGANNVKYYELIS